MPTRLSICGFDRLDEFRDTGVTHIVSIFDPGESDPDLFQSFGAHQRLDLCCHDIIDDEPNMVCVQRGDIDRLLAFGRAIERDAGAAVHLLVHCHAGMSRSTAAMTILLAQDGETSQVAVQRMLALQPNAWPNLRMIELGDEALGCGGQLIAAVGRHYAEMVERYPEFGSAMRGGRHLRDCGTITTRPG